MPLTPTCAAGSTRSGTTSRRGLPESDGNAEQLSFLFFFYLIEGIDRKTRSAPRRKRSTKACSRGLGA